jgi:hypothetical protein
LGSAVVEIGPRAIGGHAGTDGQVKTCGGYLEADPSINRNGIAEAETDTGLSLVARQFDLVAIT